MISEIMGDVHISGCVVRPLHFGILVIVIHPCDARGKLNFVFLICIVF